MEQNFVFDIGLNRGEDSEFYLKKGFNVIGVEANLELCEEVCQAIPRRNPKRAA